MSSRPAITWSPHLLLLLSTPFPCRIGITDVEAVFIETTIPSELNGEEERGVLF